MRTAKTNIKIQNAGVALTTGGFDTINLVSGITAVDSGGGITGFTGSGSSGANIATEVLTASTSGSDITLDLTGLAHTFIAIEVVFRNGQAVTPGASGWTRSSNTITVFNADSSEVFQVQYTY